MSKTAGKAAQRIVTTVLLGLWLAPWALAQTDTDSPDSGAEQSLTGLDGVMTVREKTAEAQDEEYVNMPEIIAIGKRWRLDEEVKEELWRAEQAQESRNLQEREYNDRFKSGAVAETTSSSGRFKAEFLPLYDPRNARVVDMGVDNSRTEVVDLFKGKF